MKKLLFIMSFLFSVNAFSCPDFSGSYICEEGVVFRNITQVVDQDGFTIYQILTNSVAQTYTADSRWHPVNMVNIQEAEYKASCTVDVLSYEIRGLIQEKKYKSMTKVQMKSGRLIFEIATRIGNHEYPIEKEICEKI